MASLKQFEQALTALNSELNDVASWSETAHDLFAREMQEKGRIDLDYRSLDKKMKNLRMVLAPAEQVEFDACVKEVKMAFSAIIIHTSIPYENQLNIMPGWLEAWAKLESALKGINIFLSTLTAQKKQSGRSGGSAGPRNDFFTIEQSCA